MSLFATVRSLYPVAVIMPATFKFPERNRSLHLCVEVPKSCEFVVLGFKFDTNSPPTVISSEVLSPRVTFPFNVVVPVTVKLLVTVREAPTITLSGSPTVTVELVLETSISLAVPLIVWTAPVALSARTTLPEVTVKSPESKDAIPLFVSDASSAEIVTVSFVTAVSIPSPPVKVNVPPTLKSSNPV